MHHLLVLCEGIADRPVDRLRQRTPLQIARCPATSQLAKDGRCGMLAKRSDMVGGWPASMLQAFLGLDDDVRRGPCEWLATGGEHDGAAFIYHASLVTVQDGVIQDASPRLSYEETRIMAEALDAELASEHFRFRAVSAGHLVVAIYWAPRDMPQLSAVPLTEGKRVVDLLAGVQHEQVRSLIEKAQRVLSAHPVNEVRVDLGENPANSLWPWEGGWSREAPPAISPEDNKEGGVVVAGSAWVEGAAQLAGWEIVTMRSLDAMDGEGPAFEFTDLLELLRTRKNCLVYIDSPNILGNFDDPSSKVRAWDQIDFYLIRHLRTLMDASRPMRFSLLADSLVRSETGRPATGALPFAIAGDGIEPDLVERFSEIDCLRGDWGERSLDAVRKLVWNAESS